MRICWLHRGLSELPSGRAAASSAQRVQDRHVVQLYSFDCQWLHVTDRPNNAQNPGKPRSTAAARAAAAAHASGGAQKTGWALNPNQCAVSGDTLIQISSSQRSKALFRSPLQTHAASQLALPLLALRTAAPKASSTVCTGQLERRRLQRAAVAAAAIRLVPAKLPPAATSIALQPVPDVSADAGCGPQGRGCGWRLA